MMENKRCLITGCNSGIGKETAKELGKKGYEIIMLVRDSDKSRASFEEIKSISKAEVHLYYADFGSLESIRVAARKIKSDFKTIEILINNAGVFKKKMAVSEDDFEYMFAVNYLAPFLLTNMLLPLLKKAESARIINLSSMLYKRGSVTVKTITGPKVYNADKIYARTKNLINLFTLQLANVLQKNNITVNAVHPGVVATDVMRDYSKTMQKFLFLFCIPIHKGADPVIYLASSEDVKNTTGSFFNKRKITEGVLTEKELAAKIWKKTEDLLRKAQNKKDELGF